MLSLNNGAIMKLRNVTLEMSPKPFRVMREDAIREVCRTAFRQWELLTREAEQISVMLWTADGSEILDYRGRADDEVEWARYIGYPNAKLAPVKGGPAEKDLHAQAVYYMDDPPKLTVAEPICVPSTARRPPIVIAQGVVLYASV